LPVGVRATASDLGQTAEAERKSLLAFVRRRMGPHRDGAEDIVQEAFVVAYRNAKRFEGRSTVKTWLYGIALNLCRQHLRRRVRIEAQQPDLETSPDGLSSPDTSLDPFMRLEQSERRALVRAAIERLPVEQRRVIHLREFDDMSYDDMAVLLRVPVGTVRSRLYNARAALLRALAGTARERSI
jgi:RNA polymerase sigma-70 factor (ECF subfamily)